MKKAAFHTLGCKVNQYETEAMKEQFDVEVDRRKILLPDPIKSHGTYTVEVKLHPEFSAKFTVVVHA